MERARRTAAKEADEAARAYYGRLLSILAARSGDIAAVEDALADAFAAALSQWPRDGVPANPLGWLMIAARRSLGHAHARRQTAERARDLLQLLQDERDETPTNPFGDARLALMFVCTHPAIDPAAQTPLMLQTVLGLDAARIAASFLVPNATMGQRLVRAKRKIRDAQIAFAMPEPDTVADRTDAIIAAIYAAFGTAWDDVGGADHRLAGLSAEAIWLARLLHRLIPDDAEAIGLLALMLHCEARRDARRDAGGAFVPLHRQDMTRWSRPMILEAEAMVRLAAGHARPGRFQTEAAIQSLHAHQRMTGQSFAGQLAGLYDLLAQFAPTTGVLAARAVAYAENGDPAAGLAQLDRIDAAWGYQPWWAARARICWLAGDEVGAQAAADGRRALPPIRRSVAS